MEEERIITTLEPEDGEYTVEAWDEPSEEISSTSNSGLGYLLAAAGGAVAALVIERIPALIRKHKAKKDQKENEEIAQRHAERIQQAKEANEENVEKKPVDLFKNFEKKD